MLGGIEGVVPNGRVHLIQGAGHYLQEDAGEEVAERIVTFLRDEAKIVGEVARDLDVRNRRGMLF